MDDGPLSAVLMSALNKELPVYGRVYKTFYIAISAVTFFILLLHNNNHLKFIVSVASVPVVVTCS